MPSDIFDEIEATPDTTTDIFDQIAPSPELLKERPAFDEEPIPAPPPVAPPPRVSRPIDLAPFAPSPIAAMAKSMEPSLDMERGIVSPEIVPTGAAISRATGLPKVVTVPASAVGRTAAGAVGYVTSPKGAAMTLGAATPAAPAVFAKWAYDMLKGGVESVKDATERVKSLIGGAITSGMISHNQLGLTPDAGKKDIDEAIQGLAEDAVNAAAMGLGGVSAAVHGVRTTVRMIPTRPAAPVVPPVTGAVLRPPAERGVVTAIGPEVLPPPGVEVPPPAPPVSPPSPRAIPSLPAVEPGFVRVFSGTRFPGSKSSWFSTNVKRAGEFAGDRGEVNYVDVPKEEFEAAAERAKEGGSFTPGDALLSNKWVNQAKSLREELIKRSRVEARAPEISTKIPEPPPEKPVVAITPTLVIGDKNYIGESHAAARKNAVAQGVDEAEAIIAEANDANHKFIVTENGVPRPEPLTREEAAPIFDKISGNKEGTTKSLRSEDLRDAGLLKHLEEPKAKAPPAPTPTTERGSAGTITFETYDEPAGEWQKQTRNIVISKSTIPGDKPWRATVFAGAKDSPVAIGHIQLDSPKDISSPAAIKELAEQLGRYTRNIDIKTEAPPAPPSPTPPATAAKEPWQMTVRERLANAGGETNPMEVMRQHLHEIRGAIKRGDPISGDAAIHYQILPEILKAAKPYRWDGKDFVPTDTRPTYSKKFWNIMAELDVVDMEQGRGPDTDVFASRRASATERLISELNKAKPAPQPAAPAAETVPVNERFQTTNRGRDVYMADLALENAKDDFVVGAITSAPSYPKLLKAYHRSRRAIHGDRYDPSVIERHPWDLLTADSGIMNAKSQTAKTLRALAAAVVQETGLPIHKEGRFRGQNGVDWDKIEPPPTQASGEVPPIGQGPGGMTRRVSARPEPPPETLEATGLKHAIDELERVSYGFAARTLPEKQAMATAWQRAGAILAQDADAGRKLTQALVLNPKRGLSADESALILRHKVGLENAVNDAAERTLTTTGDAKVESNAQLDRSRAELNDLLDAVAARGTEWGREGRWRQALAYEDYSFATQERLLSAAKGRPLTDAERVELQRQLADYKAKFDALEKSQAEREQRAVDIAVKEALDKVEKQAAAAPKYGPRVLQVAENFAKYMDAKGDAALQRLRERASRMTAGVDPAIVSDLAIWGASKATRGVVEFAKWSDMAISELGEWVRPHLEAAWEASKKLLDSELTVLEKKVGKPTTTAIKKKISERTTEENIADLSEKISTKLEENDLSAVAPLVRKLARFYVESGVRGRDNLINSVHAVLQDIVPGITRSDTMRAIAGYGDYKLLPKDAVSIILRGYKGEMQQIAKLEDMAAGIAPAKTGIERRTPTEEERTLIKQVEEAKKKGGYAVTDPETQLRTAMDAVKRRLENQIADLEKQISTREKIVKDPTRLEYDAEANQLKARRDELKKEFDEIFPKQPMTEVERLALWKKRTQRRIDEIREMVRTGDIEIKPPKPPVALDVEGRRLQAALAESKENLKHAREKAEWEKMSVFQKARRGAVDSYDAARMLMTTGEFSFVLRQGKWTFLSRPLTTIRALPGMFQAMRNWRTAHEVDLKIFNDPEYPAAKAAKLHLIDESASLTRQEEIYAGRWAHAIPVVAHFNRAARVFLNKIRFDTWKAMRKSVGRDGVTTPAEDLAIATFVNESTGRGGLGFAEQAAVPMGRAFFAPRYTVSRFQLLAGHSLWKGSGRSRRVIATEYARALIGLGIYYSLLNAYFAGSKDKRRISLDPRSADFGKVRLGNTRLDPLAGVQQAAVFIGRTATGETVTQKGKTISIRRAENVKPRYGDPTWTDIAARFARSKMHPVPGAIANLFSGTTMDGRATSFAKETGNLVGPITYFDIYQALNEQDIPDAMALSLLAVLGEGLQTYKPKK